MHSPVYTDLTGYLVDRREAHPLDVLGPTIQYLTPPEGEDREPCVMLGTIPPGVTVPLGTGEIFHVPGNAKHAWRNRSPEPAATIIVSTVKIGRFFGELGPPFGPAGTTAWPPAEQAIQRFLETADRYGYWNTPPEENAGVGLKLS